MKIIIKAEVIDVFSKDYLIDGKVVNSYKVSVLNEDWNTADDRIVNISILEDLYKKLGLEQENNVKLLVGKVMEFDCVAIPQDKGLLKVKIIDMKPTKEKLDSKVGQ